MMTILRVALLAALMASGFAHAADLASIDRTIKREPAYQSQAPRYALLVFGPEARDRVWLVHDGDTLYVDRNGDGDLTESDEKVPAKLPKARNPNDTAYEFPVGELRVGGRVHKSLRGGEAQGGDLLGHHRKAEVGRPGGAQTPHVDRLHGLLVADGGRRQRTPVEVIGARGHVEVAGRISDRRRQRTEARGL